MAAAETGPDELITPPPQAIPRSPLRACWTTRSDLVLVGVVLLATVWWAIPRRIQAGDAGEFATVMLRGGVPHPSGYPWMRLLGLPAGLLEELGVLEVCAAALPPALLGVVGWIVLCAALTRVASRGSAIVCVLLASTSSVVVLHSFDSEVWGPLVLFTALVLRHTLARPWPPLALGLLWGCAVSHHLTCGLLAPLVLASAWHTNKAILVNLRRLGQLGLGGFAGSTMFLSLMVGTEGAWRWGDTASLTGWLHHVLRLDYGLLRLSLHTETPSVWHLWERICEQIGASLSVGALAHPIAAALGLLAVAASARRPTCVPRRVWAGLLITTGLVTLVFPAMHDIDPRSPFGAWILERFDIMPIVLWTVLCSCALARVRPTQRAHMVFAGICGCLLVAAQLLRTAAFGLPSREAGVEAYALDVLRTPTAPKALVIGTDDHRTFPILFAQEVLGAGSNVLYLDAQLLHHPFYREHLRRKWPNLPEVDKPLRLIAALWRSDEFRETPIYLTNLFSRPAARQLKTVPEGLLWRVIPPHADPSLYSPDAVVRRHLRALAGYRARSSDFAGLTHPRTHPWSGDLWHAYHDGTKALTGWLEQRVEPGLIQHIRDTLHAQRERGPRNVAVAPPTPWAHRP
ncbi:MAG: hypothetical protein V3V08_24905 [Nannocystaceae bacterium]